ncbi:TPA: glycosyltransferase family 2 protein [Streptococcus suis]
MEAQYPLVTIVVPIYNVAKYLEKCLLSIIGQTYTKLQIILVNDGSTDSSLQICKTFEKKDCRVEIIDKKNGGLSDARNTGIDYARGEYILLVDSDDYISPKTVETCLQAIEITNSDIVEFQAVKVSESTKFIFEDTGFEKLEIYGHSEAVAKCLSYDNKIVAWNKLYKKNLFEEIRYPIGKLHEDEFTTPYIVDKVTNYCKISAVLYAYVQREGSIMNDSFNDNRLVIIDAHKERIAYFTRKYEDKYKKILLYSYFSALSNLLMLLPKSHAKFYKLKKEKSALASELLRGNGTLDEKFKVILKVIFPSLFSKLVDRKSWRV